MAYCGSCGSELQAGDAFCRSCGAPIAPASGAPAALIPPGSAASTGAAPTQVFPAVAASQPAEQYAPPRRRSSSRIALISAAAILVVAGVVIFGLTQCRGANGGVPVGSTVPTATSVLGTSGNTTASQAPATNGSATTGSATTGGASTTGGTQPSPTTAATNPDDVTHQPTFITKSSKRADGTPLLTFDYVTWLTGSAAEKAAKAHGDTVENDYYVVNDNTRLRTFPLANDAEILLHPGGDPAVSRTFTAEEFTALIKAGTANYGGQDYVWRKDTVYWLTIKNGVVTKVEHQWVP